MNNREWRASRPGDAQDPLASLRALVSTLGERSRSTNTRRAYDGAWGRFENWAKDSGLSAFPASSTTLSLYVAHLYALGRKAATIELAVSAISQRHTDANLPSPRNDRALQRVLRGVKREIGRETTAKAPLLSEHLERLAGHFSRTTRDSRDLAILTLGFATGLRRAELTALNLEDVEITDAAVVLVVRRSKSDGIARGRILKVGARDDKPDCPVRALRTWLTASSITSGPVFRPISQSGEVLQRRLNEKAIVRLVKASARRLGLDETRFGAHSLRSGFATTAADEGVADTRIMKVLGHSNLNVTARYIRSTTTR